MNIKKGFTLIELLVVIAIIGILASVVLASLSTARNKGVDASIKLGLDSARSKAELFYGDTGSYQNLCTSGSENISELMLGAAQRLSPSQTVGADADAFSYAPNGGVNAAVCHDTALGWAAIVSLRNPSVADSGWCIDSSGRAMEVTDLSANSVQCGL